MEKILKKYSFVFISAIFLLTFILRFYNLSVVPNGLYQDETAIGYNAYSILQTGKDEYGKSYPLYFKSFGDQKLPVYIYLTSFSEKIFGVNAFAVRAPSALFGSLSIIILFMLVKNITKDYSVSTLSALLLTVSPWHLLFSRAGFEVNVALFFSLTGVFLLVLGKNKSKWQILCLISAVLMFGLSLYSYNVTRLLSPLLAFGVMAIYRKDFLRIANWMKILIALFVIAVLSPFILSFFSDAGASSASGALITSSDVQAKAIEFRSYFIEYPTFSKIFFNKWNLIIWTYFENLASVLNSNFFFVNGSEHGNQGISTAGVFHLFQLPLFLAGLIALMKIPKNNYSVFIFWGVVSFLVLGLSKEVPHATRGYFLIIPVTIFTAVGASYILKFVENLKSILRIFIYSILIVFVSFNIVYFLASFFVRFPIAYAKEWRQQDQNLVTYLEENQHKYNRIIIDDTADFIYTSYLFYSKFNPDDFYRQVKRLPDDDEGFSKVVSFGKIEYKIIDWSKDLVKGNLIITNENNLPGGTSILTQFKYPQRPIVVSLKERVYEFPESKTAYILVEGKNE